MTDFHKKSIQSLLSEKRLAEAFAELRQTAQTLQNWQLNNRLDELEESYKYMIRYVADGCNDPQREEIHNGITAKLMELADITEQELTVPELAINKYGNSIPQNSNVRRTGQTFVIFTITVSLAPKSFC